MGVRSGLRHGHPQKAGIRVPGGSDPIGHAALAPFDLSPKYTAVTRGKKLVMIIGQGRVLTSRSGCGSSGTQGNQQPSLLNLNRPQVLTWFEPNALPLRNPNASACLDVPPVTTLSWPWLEHAKATNLNAVACEQGFFHAVGEQVNYLEGSNPGAGMHLHQLIGNVDFDQWSLHCCQCRII